MLKTRIGKYFGAILMDFGTEIDFAFHFSVHIFVKYVKKPICINLTNPFAEKRMRNKVSFFKKTTTGWIRNYFLVQLPYQV